MLWALPTRVEVGGTSRENRGDYRYILRIIHNLSNPDREESVNRYVSMALFYVHFREMPERLYPEALEKLYWFIDIGELPDTKIRPRVMDWEQDYHAIVADINKVRGMTSVLMRSVTGGHSSPGLTASATASLPPLSPSERKNGKGRS